MNEQRAEYLLNRYLENTCTESEWQELYSIMNNEQTKAMLQQVLAKMMQNDPDQSMEYDSLKWQPVIDKILHPHDSAPAPVVQLSQNIEIPKKRHTTHWKWVAAACIAVAFAIGFSWKTFFVSSHQNNYNVDAQTKNIIIQPEHAILTLADGSQIILDSIQNGELVSQGNTKIIKLSQGQLVYKGHNQNIIDQFNTIATPKGVQYQVVLPDGTKVWLNAASSLRFPVAFDGQQRKVFLTGEAYFEVAQLTGNPFIVNARETNVQVLSTNFNIMAYSDEEVLKTTLLEGKIKVSSGMGKEVLLSPNQQAQYKPNDAVKIRSNVDIEEVMAWKNNFFYFRDSDIETIMRQLSRRYNIQVEFKEKINYRFYAEIPHNQDLSAVLKALSLTGNVRFDVNGNTIKVMR